MNNSNYKNLSLPDFTIVSASAGSGKTTALALRFLQLLLSDQIPNNNLKNILAITFTNNAALEMKERIIEYLKRVSFGDELVLGLLKDKVNLEKKKLIERSGEMVEHILNNYSDFQVQTIDSFLTRIMKASALEFGFPPRFEVALDREMLLDDSFNLLNQQIVYDKEKQTLIEELVSFISETQKGNAKFIWDPFEKLSDEVKRVFNILTVHTQEPVVEETKQDLYKVKGEILGTVCQIGEMAEKSKLEISKNYLAIIESAKSGNLNEIIEKSLTQTVVKKPQYKSKLKIYETVIAQINLLQEKFPDMVSEYSDLFSRTKYQPYVRAYDAMKDNLEKIKRCHAEIYLGDANKQLARAIRDFNIPEIYFSMGERIYHYLIDEFQDTSPIQWEAMKPLIEETLSKNGSLFIVGDTKQAIYSFRGGDWQIMSRLLEGKEKFLSVDCSKETLKENWRSGEVLVDFTKKVFHKIVPEVLKDEKANLSGLLDYQQEPEQSLKGKGYVEVTLYDAPEEDPEEILEKKKIVDTIADCLQRGCKLSDIAILTPRNNKVVEISGWLSEAGYRFLSYSSLDIRSRKITGEILSLLKFLDSPIDNLSFATFLLGDIFAALPKSEKSTIDISKFLFDCRNKKSIQHPLYVEFRNIYPEVWEKYFESLFNLTGYLPTYDLLTEIYRVFHLFERRLDEEAALIKLLEVLNTAEQHGSSSLKDFLRYTEEDSDDASWNISTAPGEEAITVMNIHKAKGLGFRIVILVLYDFRPKSTNEVLTIEEGKSKLLYVTKKESEKSDYLKQIYDNKKSLDLIDELNRLYVGLTRAREEMYILSIKSKQSGANAPSKYLPKNNTADGNKNKIERRPVIRKDEFNLFHVEPTMLAPSATYAKIGFEETRRGEFIHQVLENITTIDDPIEQQIDEAIRISTEGINEKIDLDSVKSTLIKFLKIDAVRSIFKTQKGRIVLNEKEIVDKNGELKRIDRLIVGDNSVIIIDFKTGAESEKHRNQVESYIEAIENLYPQKIIKGIIAYVDIPKLVEVEWVQ